MARVEQLLEAGYRYAVDIDLKNYFGTLDHEILMRLVEERVSDGRVLGLIRTLLGQGILEDGVIWTPEQGSPQGSVLSPLLSNIYLNPLDHLMAKQGFQMVRYADDFVVLCRTPEEAQAALELIREWVDQARLVLHPQKTRVVHVDQGFDFLGYHFRQGYRWPRRKSIKKCRDTIRQKTHRTNGTSLRTIIADVNRTLRGWFEYFQYSHWTTFQDQDGWVRMRLRSILRKRRKKRGRGRGSDHQRWPNAFFTQHGLFSLATAHALVSQSALR